MRIDTSDRDPETFAIIGAAMRVHRELGRGFLEVVYRAALTRELAHRGVPTRLEVPLPVLYRGERLPVTYRADFVCFDSVIVEIKASSGLASADESQVLNYLKASGFRRALLVNFGTQRLQYRRFVS